MQQQFNADINVIGSIPDFRLIEVALAEFAKGKGRVDLRELLVTNNAFDFRTESTRKRFLAAVERTILVFSSERHRQLMVALFNAPGLEALKRWAIFLQLLAGNNLFRILTREVYLKVSFSGRTTIAADEFFAYLKDLQSSSQELRKFSESTLQKIASKYLTILKKLGMVDGAVKKRLLNIRLSENELIFFVYVILSMDDSTTDILKSPYREFLFLEREELIRSLKNISFMPFINIASTGESLSVQLKLSPQELVDAISHGTKAKI
jgi:hypothetical protein